MKSDIVPKKLSMLPRARELRRNMTPQEHKLWFGFLRDYPVKFYKQRIIECFIVDFYCSKAQLVIEVDGGQHYTEQGEQYDAERTNILRKYRLQVLRFPNNAVDKNCEGVCQVIHQTVQERLGVNPDDLWEEE